MLTAPIPLDEPERLRALELLDVLDSASEREFDVLVTTATLVCGVPISLVSLIDHDRQWFKANVGLPSLTETPRDVAFCAHAILYDGIFEVPDTLADPRFADNPLVTTVPDIRFYAGATLRLSDGAHVGTLCVIDRVPRQLSQQQREALRLLSIAVVQALESRRMARAFLASEARFRMLSESSLLGVFATDAAGACTYTNAR
jgi:GAF domain-containing protein